MNLWLELWKIVDLVSVNVSPPNEIAPTVCEYFHENCVRALSISWCESFHNPYAYNPEGSYGIFQIYKPVWGRVFADHWHDRYDVEQNTRFARFIYDNTAHKFDLWTCGRK